MRDLPKPPPRSREQAQAIARRGWEATLNRREQKRQRVKDTAHTQIGELTDREMFL